MSRSPIRPAFLGIALALAATFAFAAGPGGGQAAKARQVHMKALGASAKALVEQLRSGKPDPAVVKLEAARIETASKELPGWFPVGSGPESGVKTRALPLIWTDSAGFSAAAQRFAMASGKLDATVGSGDMAGLGAAVQGVGAACKGCHDKFRTKEDS